MAKNIQNNMRRIKDEREEKKKTPKFILKRVGGGFREQMVEEDDSLIKMIDVFLIYFIYFHLSRLFELILSGVLFYFQATLVCPNFFELNGIVLLFLKNGKNINIYRLG